MFLGGIEEYGGNAAASHFYVLTKTLRSHFNVILGVNKAVRIVFSLPSVASKKGSQKSLKYADRSRFLSQRTPLHPCNLLLHTLVTGASAMRWRGMWREWTVLDWKQDMKDQNCVFTKLE